MTTYRINGVRLRTSATRRFLVVSVMDGRARVEASTDDVRAAGHLIAGFRRDFAPAPRCTLHLLDQQQVTQ